MKKYFVGVLCASVLMLAVVAPAVNAQSTTTTPTVASLMEILQGLLKQLQALQQMQQTSHGEIKAGLREGVEDPDVRKIQELLASDPTLYPRGLITGYYGPLTVEAVRQFQVRNNLLPSGVVDEATREYLIEYYIEYKANRGAAALWAVQNREAIQTRIESRRQQQSTVTDPIDDRTNQSVNITSARAEDEITLAATSIINLEDVLEETDARVSDIRAARADLEDAQGYLNQAQQSFSAAKYQSAYEYAQRAQNSVRDGLDELSEEVIDESFADEDEWFEDEYVEYENE